VEGLVPATVTGVVENVHAGAGVPPGKPDEQESEMFAVYVLLGVRVIWYDAGWPATTIGVTGSADTVKEFTVTVFELIVFEKPLPTTCTVPLLLKVPAPLGVRFTVTVDVLPPFMIPRLQSTVPLVAVVGHVPPEADAETKLAGALPLPLPRLSRKTTPAVVSPTFCTV
jgi:hypothetical protein